MSKASKPVAKSLHTITVIVQVAKLCRGIHGGTVEAALESALVTLGLAGRDDPYGLAKIALNQLKAGK